MTDPSAKIQRVELPEDLILEVLKRVDGGAALVRCATACKRWHALVADLVRRRHQVLMAAVGVYEAEWALSKVLRPSDVDPNQNRLLLSEQMMVHDGPVPWLFPELELELEQVGMQNAHHPLPQAAVILIDAKAGVEKVATVWYMNGNMAYRIIGLGWREFVRGSGILEGDRVDLYAGRRRNGERCLLFFNSKVVGVRLHALLQ